MMIVLGLLLCLTASPLVSASCSVSNPNPAEAKDAENYKAACISVLKDQVRMEFEASLQYLLMGAFFTQDSYNLPGVAGIFWSHADEEREHGKAFIEYLRMRGYEDNDFFGAEPVRPRLSKSNWTSVSEALRDALDMEKAVSGSMKRMIDICSQGGEDDPHAADWLTGTWLEEQLTGQRHLAGLVNTLESFSRDHVELGEWMFDQQLAH